MHTPITLDGITVHQADAAEALRGLPDASIDAVVTDPPYGLSVEPDPVEVLTHWLNGDDYTHTGAGFMGSTWDSFVPGPTVWREVLRVLKPGGYAVVFASTRTVDLMGIALRLAGFEVRDQLAWHYSQGFPKSLDLAKAFEKNNEPDLAATYRGYGTALKPALEPIILVRKPLEGTYIDNARTHSTGGLNIGACRVQTTDGDGSRDGEATATKRYTEVGGTNFAPTPGPRGGSPEGRFPSNVVFTHHPACQVEDPNSSDGCHYDCPVKHLDTQSGIRTSGKPGTYKGTPNRSAAYGAESRQAGEAMTGFGDSGGASRFYPAFKYASKADSDDRATVYIPTQPCVDAGHQPDPHNPDTHWADAATPDPHRCSCGTAFEAYQHPTVKPLNGCGADGGEGEGLMEWLLRLTTPVGGTVLDLYAGTGTTGVAAVAEGYRAILIERDPTHVAMIHKRLTEPIQTSLFGGAA